MSKSFRKQFKSLARLFAKMQDLMEQLLQAKSWKKEMKTMDLTLPRENMSTWFRKELSTQQRLWGQHYKMQPVLPLWWLQQSAWLLMLRKIRRVQLDNHLWAEICIDLFKIIFKLKYIIIMIDFLLLLWTAIIICTIKAMAKFTNNNCQIICSILILSPASTSSAALSSGITMVSIYQIEKN